MNSAQKKQEYKYTDARIKANRKYSNNKWRTNIFIDVDKRENIETWLNEHGYKSLNEYVTDCLKRDGII